jgi:aldehyde:ferredoxin oxidoreductase
VLWEEVPASVKAFDPANRIIMCTGPLTGSGSPLSGRFTIVSRWPNHLDELPGHASIGGHWGPELKYAGWDNVIVQGKAAKPVWIKIVDDKVTIEDASQLWGNGIYRATAEIITIMGPEAHVLACGQAGENLVRISNVMCDRKHSAGSVGGIFGSKNLKAIGVRGTGAVKIAADKQSWKDLTYYYLSLLGSNNQHVVPSTPQPWAEYYDSGSRWTARSGLYWGAASPPVETGVCTPQELNKLGYRCHKGDRDYGAAGANHTVKMDGCHACPIRCNIATDVPVLETYGISRYNMNTCLGNSVASSTYISTASSNPDMGVILSQMSNNLCDDWGLWSDYGQWENNFKYCYTHVMTAAECTAIGLPAEYAGKTTFQNRIPADEYAKIPWSMMDNKLTPNTCPNPLWMQFLVPYISQKKGVLGATVAEGPARVQETWPEVKYFNQHVNSLNSFKMGHIKHHGAENGGQVGALVNMAFNRDPMNHTHSNFISCGLPLEIREALSQKLFCQGESIFNATDGSLGQTENSNYSPMTMHKAAFAAASICGVVLANSLTTCNWTLPIWASPLKDRGPGKLEYEGDNTLEAQSYSAVTGDPMTQKGLETVSLRILTLFRALTARYMEFAKPGDGKNMRTAHDYMNDWMFDYPPAAVPFTPGNYKMDRADMDLARDLLYDQFGWDRATGMPTAATLSNLGLDYVATVLAAEGLLP